MKIKKSLLTGLAVLALFGAGVSISVSSVNSVEANAAVHHKNSKKHKKARKSVKKHKKAKKAVKKHKKVAKKSKKRVAKKAPTIFIKDDNDTVNHVKYSQKVSKSYNNVDIAEHNSNNDGDAKHDMSLRNITYYKLYGDKRFKTAITLKLSYRNEYSNDENIDNNLDDTYLVNNDGEKLSDAWGDYEFAATVPGNSHRFLNLTFYSSKRLSLDSFSTFDFYYDVNYETFGPTINY